MPGYTLTNGYTVKKTHKKGETQTVFLTEKYGNHTLVLDGIPANIELSGNAEMSAWHLSSTEEKVRDPSRPDHVVFSQVDEKGNIVPNSLVELFRGKDGTYRRQTEEEVQKTDAGNAAIIAELLDARRGQGK